MKRLIMLLSFVVLVATGCGTDGATTTTTDASPTTAADAAATTTETAAETTTTTEVTTTTVAAASGSNDFCTRVATPIDFSETINPSLDADGLRGALEQLESRIAEARLDSPAEITDAIDTIAANVVQLRELLEDYEYDFMALASAPDDPRLQELNSPEVLAATAELEAYCGF